MNMIEDDAKPTASPRGSIWKDGVWTFIYYLKHHGRGLPTKYTVHKVMKREGYDPDKYGFKLTPAREGGAYNLWVAPLPSKAKGVGTINPKLLKEMIMGRRPYTSHGSQRIDPDEFYNENDNSSVMDKRDVDAAVGIGAGAGAYGTPAGTLISGYAGPTVATGKFPYSTGVGQALKKAEKAWQPTGISLGLDMAEARKKFDAMLPNLKATDPSSEYKMGSGQKVEVGKIQRRRAGFIWDTVVTVPNPTDDSVRTAADEYKRKHPDAQLRIKKDTATDYTVFKR
jgi:hypothetical protein